jgi:hypothetical protein
MLGLGIKNLKILIITKKRKDFYKKNIKRTMKDKQHKIYNNKRDK